MATQLSKLNTVWHLNICIDKMGTQNVVEFKPLALGYNVPEKFYSYHCQRTSLLTWGTKTALRLHAKKYFSIKKLGAPKDTYEYENQTQSKHTSIWCQGQNSIHVVHITVLINAWVSTITHYKYSNTSLPDLPSSQLSMPCQDTDCNPTQNRL